MESKLQEFGRLLENDQIDRIVKQNLDCDANIFGCIVKIEPRKKYTCVNVGTSGKYMVDNITEEIFGIKGYGKVNKLHRYGTLDTIYNYYWGMYTAILSKENRKNHITELMSSVRVLEQRGVFIDENGRLYGGIFGEKKEPEQPKPEKVFTENKYEELTKDLRVAKNRGTMAASLVEDSGTCNLDGVFIRLKGFNEENTIQAIKNSGLNGFLTTHSFFKKGYLIGMPEIGQAYKREKAVEIMYNYLKELGYDISHWQQMD